MLLINRFKMEGMEVGGGASSIRIEDMYAQVKYVKWSLSTAAQPQQWHQAGKFAVLCCLLAPSLMNEGNRGCSLAPAQRC